MKDERPREGGEERKVVFDPELRPKGGRMVSLLASFSGMARDGGSPARGAFRRNTLAAVLRANIPIATYAAAERTRSVSA